MEKMKKSKKSQGRMKKRMNEIKKLESISGKTGQFLKGVDEIEGLNLFNDLNYGDFLMVFFNPFYEFQF